MTDMTRHPARIGIVGLWLGIAATAVALVIGILFMGINALTFFVLLAGSLGLAAIVTGIVALVRGSSGGQAGMAIAGIVVGGALPIVALFGGRAIGAALGIG